MTHSKNNLEESAIETLTYYRSKVRTWIRWVENYRERTKLMMSLLFSIGSQADSRTNLGIADLTARIAFDTQKDSSSMITIAAVTMVFLPGTFVSDNQDPQLHRRALHLSVISVEQSWGFRGNL
ncbi:MAG: hypothetical protein LQ341_001205 [Variospora aurantia]|nr:MAG: hypothetical protein LQ341_001205 [Variospora aurantia]